MTQPCNMKKAALVDNAAHREQPAAVKRAGNVIGLFTGTASGFCQKKTSATLTLAAARLELERLEARLAEIGIGLIVNDEALVAIARTGFDPVYGAWPLKKAIKRALEDPLLQALLEGKFAAKDTIKVGLKAGGIAFGK